MIFLCPTENRFLTNFNKCERCDKKEDCNVYKYEIKFQNAQTN